MGDYYHTYKAEPAGCGAFIGLFQDSPAEEGDTTEAYCDECEERHRFTLVVDE